MIYDSVHQMMMYSSIEYSQTEYNLDQLMHDYYITYHMNDGYNIPTADYEHLDGSCCLEEDCGLMTYPKYSSRNMELK